MKKIISFFTVAALLFISCQKVDLSPLEKRIAELERRLGEVENTIKTLNTNTSGLQTAVTNLEKNIFVKEVRMDADGYTIVFSDGSTAVIKNGTDGTSPVVGVKKVDGVIVWTINGDPILDDAGKPIPVSGTPATPEFKFEEDTWYYKIGDGAWTPCGSGSSSGGTQASIEVTDNFVIITIGEDSIALPKEAVVDPNEPRIIDKSKMAALLFPDDSPIHPDVNQGVAAVFDGQWPAVGNYWYDFMPTYLTTVWDKTIFPVIFSFDMGDTYKLSKMIWYPRHIFCCGHPRVFEVYGATELDVTETLFDGAGNLNSKWTKLATFESFRPSGSTQTAISYTYQVVDGQNEVDVMFYGQEFTFPTDIPVVRYLRFRIMEIWGDETHSDSDLHNTYAECNEISLYAVLN